MQAPVVAATTTEKLPKNNFGEKKLLMPILKKKEIAYAFPAVAWDQQSLIISF